MEQDRDLKDRNFCEKTRCSVLLGLIVAAAVAVVVLVTLLAPFVRAPIPPTPLKWWQKTIIYQIYPRSFQDSDGDGTGDLKGIISRLDHFKYINVQAVWLSPFYKSPMDDFGYDISNFTDVDPIFGNMTDFENLIKKAHDKGIKVIVDFVPNHSSDECEWFKESRKSKTGKYRNYYIWSKTNHSTGPPNNWMSVFGKSTGSAWEYDNLTDEYYYHAFLPSQPDLNYRNPDVLDEIDNVIRFWLDKGVDGFRVDAIPHLFEEKDLSKNEDMTNCTYYNDCKHPLIRDQPEVFGVVQRWSNILKEYEKKDKKPRLLIAETSDLTPTLRKSYYEAGSVPFYFDLLGTKKKCGGEKMKTIIEGGLQLPKEGWPNFVTGNHDNSRIGTKWGPEFIDAMNMLLLTLPGTPTTYYGEEIGMIDVNYSRDEWRDPFPKRTNRSKDDRDPERSPMQWSANTSDAGFTNSTPWLRINANYKTVNVETEKNDNNSHLNIYASLSNLRRNNIAFHGKDIEYALVDDNVFSYMRTAKNERYLVVLNLGNTTTVAHMSSKPVNAENGTVVVATGNVSGRLKKDTEADLKSLQLKPGDGVVFKV